MRDTYQHTIADGFRITTVEHMLEVKEGYVMWEGVRREVNTIHRTVNGTQMELFGRGLGT